MSDRVVLNIICFQTQICISDIVSVETTHHLNIQVSLKSVLIDLHAHNFVHAKTSLRACCMHAHHCARNLSSPEYPCFLHYLYLLAVQL